MLTRPTGTLSSRAFAPRKDGIDSEDAAG